MNPPTVTIPPSEWQKILEQSHRQMQEAAAKMNKAAEQLRAFNYANTSVQLRK